MKMKPFEVPYNFDMDMINFYKQNANHVRFLFLPPYKEDSINTRTIIQSDTALDGMCYMPTSRMEYEKHLRAIKAASLEFVVLWQTSKTLTEDFLDYYISLGACGFIVATDENARIIKNYDSQLIVVCSIVQRLLKDISKKNFVNYDYVVLYYPFNRSLNVFEKLKALKEKLVIMPNTVCPTECPAMHHWFPTKENPFDERNCLVIKRMDRSSYIFPEHLYLFDEYVSGYKLQGREFPTEMLKHFCEDYFARKSGDIATMSQEYMNILRADINRMGIMPYYNVKTPEIIDII